MFFMGRPGAVFDAESTHFDFLSSGGSFDFDVDNAMMTGSQINSSFVDEFFGFNAALIHINPP